MIKRSQIDKRFLSFQTAPLTQTRPPRAQRPADDGTSGSRSSRGASSVRSTTGAAIGRIVISKIGASFDVVQGTDTA